MNQELRTSQGEVDVVPPYELRDVDSLPRSDTHAWARLGERRRPFVDRRFVVDIAALGLGVLLARVLAGATLTGPGVKWGLLFIALTLVAFRFRGLYETRLQMSPFEDFSRIVSATSTSAILLVTVRVVAGSVDGASGQAARLWVGTTVCMAIGRALLAAWTQHRHRLGYDQQSVVILGADSVGQQIARRLTDHPELGLRPVGFIDDAPSGHHAAIGGPDLPVLGPTSDVERIVREHDARQVIVAFGAATFEHVRTAVARCRAMGLQVSTVPRLLEDVNRWIEVEHLGGIPLMRSRSVDPRGWRFAVKYAIDRLAAALLLLLCAPVMAFVALLVRFSGPGPIFFRQPRVSVDGREFMMLKFRTMRGDDVRDGQSDAGWAAGIIEHEDPANGNGDGVDRRTPVGRLLRKHSLDELPQLFNVLFGDMSLVGPRPERSAYVRAFNERVYRYTDRHRVKSGLTGWAQVHGLRGETSLADRVEWDNYYIENWSLWLDFKILFLTVPAVLGRRGV